jgi:hypothetical protein
MYIPADHTDHHLVWLVANRDLRVFDLRVEQNLDVLHIDDQISTGQHAAVLRVGLAWPVERGGIAVGSGPATATNRLEDDWPKFDSCG